MRILFLHQNFPGQFLHVASHLQRQGGHDLVAVVPDTNTRPRLVRTVTYRFDPRTARTSVPVAEHLAGRMARGMAVAAVLLQLRRDGFTPDVVVGHGGWGETLFVRDVWPGTRIVLHAEFFYSATGADAGFDPEFCGTPHDGFPMDVRGRNAAMALALLDADVGVAPTQWQASRFPDELRGKIEVVHEGIDTDVARPNPQAVVRLKDAGVLLRPGDEVVTYVARNLEPHRGFHTFMRALPGILAERPRAHVVIVGGDGTSYGPGPAGGGSWKDTMLREVGHKLDLRRVHFVGHLPYAALLRVLQVSAAHVYLTYPFVLSWSMLDAMAAGLLVIGSRTPPVEEVITDGQNGLLVNFFDHQRLATAVAGALAEPGQFGHLRAAARRTVWARYDLQRACLPEWVGLVGAATRQPVAERQRGLAHA